MRFSEPALDGATLDTLRQLTREGEPDVLTEVLGLFTAEARLRLDSVRSAVRAGDMPSLERAAHTLKGAAGTIGATALERACRAAEEISRGGEPPAAAAEALSQIEREYARVEAAIGLVLAGNTPAL